MLDLKAVAQRFRGLRAPARTARRGGRAGARAREAARRPPPRAERAPREAEEGAERGERQDPRAREDRQGRGRGRARVAARARRRGEADRAGARAGRGGDRAAAAARAEPAARLGAGREGRDRQPVVADLGREAGVRLHAEAALGARRGARDPRVAAGGEAVRLALHHLRRAPAARLERAIAAFFIDVHTSRGYTEILPPYLVTARDDDRHRAAPEVRGGPLQDRRTSRRSTSSPRRRSRSPTCTGTRSSRRTRCPSRTAR